MVPYWPAILLLSIPMGIGVLAINHIFAGVIIVNQTQRCAVEEADIRFNCISGTQTTRVEAVVLNE